MADDIEAFLRRAAQKRQAKAAVATGPVAPKPSPNPPKKRAETFSSRPQTKPTPPVKVEVASMAVDQSDERMAAHLKQVFEHPVGNLGPAAMVTSDSEAPPIAVAELVRMLSVPGGIQSAILLREILDRPTHRW